MGVCVCVIGPGSLYFLCSLENALGKGGACVCVSVRACACACVCVHSECHLCAAVDLHAPEESTAGLGCVRAFALLHCSLQW